MTKRVKQFQQFGMPGFASHTGNPDRKRILDHAQSVREGTGPSVRNFGEGGGFGRAFLQIPEFDYPFIKAMFPDVTSPDAEIRRKAWLAFAKSPLSEPYRLERVKRGQSCRSITAR